MTDLIFKLKKHFRQGNIITTLIYINVAVFITTALVNLVVFLFNLDTFSLLEYGGLPASITKLAQKPWSLITHMFMHADVLHILFNMLFLYWFGGFFLYYFSTKHLRGLYILGGIVGALFFILSYNVFPALNKDIYSSSLIGASAAVLSIVVAIATKSPNQKVRFLLIGSVQLKYIAIFVVLMDLLTISSSNPGGHIAHLGGAFAGYLFAKLLTKGVDLTRWINATIDLPYTLSNAVSKRKQRRMRVVKGDGKYSKHKKDHDFNYSKKKKSEEIDRILDKIKESGYTNLSEEEKNTLFDAGKK